MKTKTNPYEIPLITFVSVCFKFVLMYLCLIKHESQTVDFTFCFN